MENWNRFDEPVSVNAFIIYSPFIYVAQSSHASTFYIPGVKLKFISSVLILYANKSFSPHPATKYPFCHRDVDVSLLNNATPQSPEVPYIESQHDTQDTPQHTGADGQGDSASPDMGAPASPTERGDTPQSEQNSLLKFCSMVVLDRICAEARQNFF